MFIRPTNDTTYLTGNEGQEFVWFSSVAELERFQYTKAIASRPFYSAENAHVYYIWVFADAQKRNFKSTFANRNRKAQMSTYTDTYMHNAAHYRDWRLWMCLDDKQYG